MLDRLRRFLTINSAVSEALTIFSKSAKKKEKKTLFFSGKSAQLLQPSENGMEFYKEKSRN